jgi:NTE family protein
MSSLNETLAQRRFGLVLSAGYFGFFAHGGLLAALEGAGLRPAAWAGTSAGALVGALGASGMSAADIAAMMKSVAKADFWDPAPLEQLFEAVRGRGMTGLLRGDRFRSLLQRRLPARFEDCREPLVIVTADVTNAASRVHVAGPLPPVVHASCAYPGLFRTVDDDGTQSWDGGLIDKAPIAALIEHADVDAILVLYLPSDTKHDAASRPRRVGYLGGMLRGLAAVRHEHYVLQAKLAEARGIPVFELSPVLPKLGPDRLALGPEVLAESARRALAAFADDANRHRPYVWCSR